MKECAKVGCSNMFEPTVKWGHETQYCSRSCANSRQFSDEEIAEVLKESVSIYAALKALKMSSHGNNYKRLRRIIKELEINIDYTV